MSSEKPEGIRPKLKICCACPETKVSCTQCMLFGSTDENRESRSRPPSLCRASETSVLSFTVRPSLPHAQTSLYTSLQEMKLHLLTSPSLLIVSKFSGPEAEECKKLIEAHKACLRKEGFKV